MRNAHATQQQFDEALNKIRFAHATRHASFASLSHELRAAVLLRLSKHIVLEILAAISDEELIATLDHLDPDETTDIVQLLDAKRRERIVALLSQRQQQEVQMLLQFDPHTAAGLMNMDYIQVDARATIAEVAKQFRVHEKRTGCPPEILVMQQGRLIGYVPGHELGFARPTSLIKQYIHRIATISYKANKNDVLELFKNRLHKKIAVLGEAGNVIGIIYSDDVLRALDEQQAVSLYNYAGVSREESVADSAKTKVALRYKWLIANLGTAFLAAFTVGLFEETISKYVLLVMYMPIVAGMGGNAATQTLAVLVRGIALKQIELKTALPTLRQELGAALVNGLINGCIVALIVTIFNQDIIIALILGLAMIANLFVAGFFGTLVPLLMKRLGKDPATSASIFITTATDVLGFLFFLGLATLLLE